MKLSRTIITPLALLGIFILTALIIWAGQNANSFSDSMGCSDHILSITLSPDASTSLIQFQRQCGATAPDTLQINLQPTEAQFDPKSYPPFLVMDIPNRIEAAWKANDLVEIKTDSVARKYRNETKSLGVRIEYAALITPQ